ncbi:lanthionine synthetase LanC family protein [Adhaeribacter rhizoryzae]|uniref:Lanthionine synthetase C family protein n=1 Tax=Adhaeribacter rhizoryzae TaxID=2607907 RepID=A0A5M6D5J2_9BACT|nr:lanthionine synthetase LanC family protein [Adhaeribacter rhizoryzae]KAA5541582.1 hypothetical protein F0145_20420 [Adhaeribacter rhizoryzae]
METKLSKLILNEAVRIGDELLAKAEKEPQGMSWKTIHQQGNNIQWHKSESIYNGVCGIVLFFAELYKQTQQEKYLQAAQEGGRWVEYYCHEHPATNYAFLTGRMSVPYTLLQLHRLTQNPEYLTKALAITKTGLKDWQPGAMEYINGLAGTLLCLVHLHAATQEGWLLEYINIYTEKLLAQTHISKKGIYWDRAPINIHGLCSFSHGASGVGYVLLELGQYLQNPAFFWLAEQAFNYEAQYYNAELNNWPDFRKMALTPTDERAQQQAYETGAYNYFTIGASMNAWCHGAAGIGLARLRAVKFLQNPEYATEAQQALAHTLENIGEIGGTASYTLCHGAGGNAEIFLQAFEVFGDAAYLEMAESVAIAAIQSRVENGGYRSGTKYSGADTSLFMGNAGIGYFYLRLLQPRQVPSVLLPSLENNVKTNIAPYSNLSLSVGNMQRKLIGKIFPRTLHLLENLLPKAVENYFQKQVAAIAQSDSFLDDFVQWAKDQMALLPLAKSHLLYEGLLVEWLKLQMNEDITSDALLTYKNQKKSQRIAVLTALSDAALAGTILVVDHDMQLLNIQYKYYPHNLAESPSNIAISADEHTLLLMPALTYTQEQELADFTATVLAVFSEEKTVAAGMQDILNQFEELAPAQTTRLQKMVLAQIRQAIRAGILLEHEQHPLPVIAKPVLAAH